MTHVPFRPQPAAAHRARWPRMIVGTISGTATDQTGRLNFLLDVAIHTCDFSDGLRLVVFISQARADNAEELRVSPFLDVNSPDWPPSIGVDQWAALICDRLSEIDIVGRPRTPCRTTCGGDGALCFHFPWERRVEEHAILLLSAQEGFDCRPLGNYLEMYTIFRKPTDYPDHFIIRRFVVFGSEVIQGAAWKACSLQDARGLIPSDKVNIGRQPSDAPAIVETWT